MRHFILISILFSFAGNPAEAQSYGQTMAIYAQVHLPLSDNDNVIPSVGASIGTSIQLTQSDNLMSSLALDFGLLRARVQNTPVNERQKLVDYDLKVYTLAGDFRVSFFVDASKRFSLGVGAGMEYAIRQHSKGTIETTIFDVKGEEILSYSDESSWGEADNPLRGILSIYFNHHFSMGETKMTLGPFFDYGSVLLGDFENEVASSKFGVQIAAKL